jgi:mannose-6-phosphate isomerase-like protein (cupin superfamily)
MASFERRAAAMSPEQARSLRSGVFHLADARSLIPGPAGEHFNDVLRRGSLRLLVSHPLRPNQQSPHAQDELYFVVRGRGVLFHDGRRDRFEAGDAMFVAAGIEHHFEDCSDDFEIWVAFYGPAGGEG